MVSGSSQPKVYDRDGHELGELPKGDMYIRDATHTKGHQYRCCGGAWHPDERCARKGRPAHSRVCCKAAIMHFCSKSLSPRKLQTMMRRSAACAQAL